MKKFKFTAIISLLTLFSSCNDSFLDRYPSDSATHATYWKTEAQLRAALYPCYEAFTKDNLLNWMEACAETCEWGNTSQGIAKIAGGKASYTDGFPITT